MKPLIKVEKIKESEWGKTYGSCQCCNKYDVTSIQLRAVEVRLCDKHLKELLEKLKEA
jgi:hypothetical protein